MFPNLRALSRYRPRILTLCLICVVAALILLANLSAEARPRAAPPPQSPQDFDLREPDTNLPSLVRNLSLGWPLRWKQYVFVSRLSPDMIVGECYSNGRLATNIAIWLAMLAVPWVACEWLLRRYRPRFRWSLRTMLGGMGIVACALGWFAAARSHADLQDAILDSPGVVWVEHWGPYWLELLGARRYRRDIVGVDAEFQAGLLALDEEEKEAHREENRQLLERLGRLPHLRYLLLRRVSLTRDIASALSRMRRLQMLTIVLEDVTPGTIEALGDSLRCLPDLRIVTIYGGDRIRSVGSELLAAVCRIPQLEHLVVAYMTLDSQSMESLDGLKNLKSLAFDEITTVPSDEAVGRTLFSRLPAMPRLEAVAIAGCEIHDDDLERLARLPRLEILCILPTHCTATCLSTLATFDRLEELAIGYGVASASGLEALRSSKSIKKFHLHGTEQEPGVISPCVEHSQFETCRGALAVLRRSRPDLVIDTRLDTDLWEHKRSVLPKYDQQDYEALQRWREEVHGWKELGASWRKPVVGLCGS